MSQKIINVTCGIRFDRRFKHFDNIGSIVDMIVYDNKHFNKEMFSRIGNEGDYVTTIVGNKPDEYIKITPSDIIMSFTFDNFDENDMKWYYNALKFIIEKATVEHNINNFSRFGIVYKVEFENENDFQKVVDSYFNTDLISPSELRFSFRKKIKDSLIKKNMNDYYNVIIQSKKENDFEGNKKTVLFYDFQRYFNPSVEDLRDYNIEKHFKLSKQELEKDIYEIIGDVINEAK